MVFYFTYRLSRREALLNCSIAYNHSQETRNRHEAVNVEQAYIRNHRLIKVTIHTASDNSDNFLHSSHSQPITLVINCKL